MKDTAEESAELKMALKHNPITPELCQEAQLHPVEADEAYQEVFDGRDTRTPGSWVDQMLTASI